MLTYPWKCTVLHCNHLGNTWKPLVLMTRHFDYCLIASEGDNQSVRPSAPVVSRCFPGGYNVKLYISRGRLPWWLLAFLHSDTWNLDKLQTWNWGLLYTPGYTHMKQGHATLMKLKFAVRTWNWSMTRNEDLHKHYGWQIYHSVSVETQIIDQQGDVLIWMDVYRKRTFFLPISAVCK